jgi:hypothetical protein
MSVAPDIIVRETLQGKASDGEQVLITIEVERPFPWGDISPTEYACYITIAPFLRRTHIHGEGQLQALCLALRHVRWELDRFLEEGGVIDDCDLGAALPFNSLEESTRRRH